MPLPFPVKLEKLKITAFGSCKRDDTPPDSLEVMFNPASLTEQWDVKYGTKEPLGGIQRAAEFSSLPPPELHVELLLDGTGVVPGAGRRSVRARVDDIRDLTWHVASKSHEPRYLRLEWGAALSFDCRLKSARVEYSSFDRAGEPLRAKVTLHVVGDSPASTLMKRAALSSPDVTHRRVVRAGDTLPLLTHEVYGTAEHYLMVACVNDLDGFRRLEPGRELAFPPLAG